MKTFLKSFVISGCIMTVLLWIGYVDLYPRLKTDVALYAHTPIEGEIVLESGDSITQSLYAYTEFNQASVILTQNSNHEVLQISLYDSENNILNELDAEKYTVERMNETDVLVKFSVNRHNESLEAGEYHIMFKNRGGGRTIFGVRTPWSI